MHRKSKSWSLASKAVISLSYGYIICDLGISQIYLHVHLYCLTTSLSNHDLTRFICIHTKIHQIRTLTLVPLVSNDDQESDASPKTVQGYRQWAEVACCLTTTGKYNILIRSAIVYLGTVNQNNHRHQYEHCQNLQTSNVNYLINAALLTFYGGKKHKKHCFM